jgi:hypothetical protein
VTSTSLPDPVFTSTPIAGALPIDTPGLPFALLETSRIVVYPNPYRADRNPRAQVIFGNMPVMATITLYDLSGHQVRRLTKNDPGTTVVWNLENADGQAVASGIYLYVVRSYGKEVSGKVALLR